MFPGSPSRLSYASSPESPSPINQRPENFYSNFEQAVAAVSPPPSPTSTRIYSQRIETKEERYQREADESLAKAFETQAVVAESGQLVSLFNKANKAHVEQKNFLDSKRGQKVADRDEKRKNTKENHKLNKNWIDFLKPLADFNRKLSKADKNREKVNSLISDSIADGTFLSREKEFIAASKISLKYYIEAQKKLPKTSSYEPRLATEYYNHERRINGLIDYYKGAIEEPRKYMSELMSPDISGVTHQMENLHFPAYDG